jgi:hypothetical protein
MMTNYNASMVRLEACELTEHLEQPLPDLGELTRLALSHRPDLHAYRNTAVGKRVLPEPP